eukprot:gene4565-5586_t
MVSRKTPSTPLLFLDQRSDTTVLFYGVSPRDKAPGGNFPNRCKPWYECLLQLRVRHSMNFGGEWRDPVGVLGELPFRGTVLHGQMVKSQREAMGWVRVHHWMEEWGRVSEWLLPLTVQTPDHSYGRSVLVWTEDSGKTWGSANMTW